MEACYKCKIKANFLTKGLCQKCLGGGVTTKPTQPEFFSNWGYDQLLKECVRLNKVLDDCHSSAVKALKIMEKVK
jgi:hypothetical protein